MSSVPPAPFKRHGTWHAFDAPLERQRLFSPWTVAGFGLAVSLGLLLVYPHRTLEHRLAAADNAKGGADTPLTIQYLKAFLKVEPEAHGLRLQLARKLVAQGDLAGARKLLDAPQLASNPQWLREAKWIRLAIAEQELYATPVGPVERAGFLIQLQGELRKLLAQEGLTPPELAMLATRALGSDAPDLALIALRRLRAGAAVLSATTYAEAGHSALGLGDYRTSSDLLFMAMARSPGREQQRRYFLDALRNLQAGHFTVEALAAAERHIGPFAQDIGILKFLARLAQAANRPDIAERYAKRFLELSLLERWQAFEDTRLVSRGRLQYGPTIDKEMARMVAVAAPAGGPGLAFDEEAYGMGYQIFLANRNLKDARRVAMSAVQQQPQSTVWRRRLAEVSEWDGAPQEALDQWLAYARQTGDGAGWDAVLRLSDALYDQSALRQALEHKLAREPGNLQWLNRLLDLHERNGEPAAAVALLRIRLDGRQTVRGAERVRELELLAALYERAGQDVDALDVLRRLQQEAGPRTAYALKIASFYYRQGALKEAFAVLEASRTAATSDDAVYWRTYAQLAALLQDAVAAQRGYQALLVIGVQSDDDIASLLELWRAERPRAAAALAVDAYARSGAPQLAEQALALYIQLGERDAARSLLAQLSPAQRKELELRASFLMLRASLAQSGEDLAGAQRDLAGVLALEPDNIEARASLLWVLLALRDTARLQDALQQWAAVAEHNPALWDPYAAALMSLNRQDEALRWFRKSGVKKKDYLWLMSYAECLDANSQPELAWSIRRHVWTELRKPEVLAQLQPQQYADMRERLAGLAPAFVGSDAAWRILQALLRTPLPETKSSPVVQPARDGRELLQRLEQADTEVRATTVPGAPQDLFVLASPRNDARLSASARELALATALNTDANELARAWLASRYADQLARPLWAELSLLLHADDRAGLNRLLDEMPDWLPMYDRVDAANQAGRPALAQTLAFDQLARLPQDEALHRRLTSLTTGSQAPLQVSVTTQRESPLIATEILLRAGTALSTGMKMSLTLSERRQHSEDAALLGNVPHTDSTLALSISRTLDQGLLTATLQRREALAGSTGLRVEAELVPLRNLRIGGAAGINQVSTDSVLLKLGGMKSGLDFNATYLFSTREYGRIDLGWQRYRAQGGAILGTGHHWRLEAGTRLRLEYPDLTLRSFVMGNSYSNKGSDTHLASLLPNNADPDALPLRLLPEGSRTWGILLSAGASAENGYHRGWRPFSEAGLTWNSVTGRGHQVRAGMAGSVFGQDVLRVHWQSVSGSPASPEGSRELGLRYHLYY